MKTKLLKWIYVFLSVIVLISSTEIEVYAKNTDESNNNAIERFLVKYKNNTLDNEEKVEQKKKNKKIKDYKKTGSKNVYIFEMEIGGYDELLADTDIELIEKDSPIQVMEDTEFNENIDDLSEAAHICNGSCDCDNSTCDCEKCTSNETCEYKHSDESVETIQEEIKLLENGTNEKFNSLGDKTPWNITRIRADRLHETGITGNGIKVAVFDTGIDLNNDDLKVAGGVSFVYGVPSYDDDNGHGTAMAGILAAKLNGSGLVGVAPNIELYAVKVMDQYGIGRYSSVLQAVDWAIENDIKIITMSFGGDQYSQILAEAIKKASDNNILVVAASGNSGSNGIYYPAVFQQVICVSAVDSNNSLAAFSNYGDQMDLTAPGVAIETLGLDNTIVTIDGTSASVQHVAGVAALLFGADNDLTNGQVKFLLYKNAFDLGSQENYGYGMVDAEKAYENLLSGNYSIPIIGEHGEKIIIPGQIDVGGDGLFSAQACSCTGCYQGSSYYNYAEHNSSYGGHRRVYYCGLSSCRSLHTYSCIYGTSTYDKLGSCTTCYPPHVHVYSTYVSTSSTHTSGSGHAVTKKCSCGATSVVSYSTNYSGCCACGNHVYSTYVSTSSTHTSGSGHAVTKKCSCGATSVVSYSTNYSGCCACGNHNYSTYVSTSSTHTSGSGHAVTNKCSCGLTSVVSYTSYSPCCTCGNHTYPSGYSCVHRGSYDEHMQYCTCGASRSIETHACTCHFCSYTTKVYGSHTSTGHDVYMKCSCGSMAYQGYKEANPNCLSCTTPPSVSLRTPLAGTCLCETDTSFKPQIDVQDNENDTLTCKYYIDSESTPRSTETVTGTSSTKTVTFTTGFNASLLSEGSHTLKAQVSDGLSPVGTATITIKVDKSGPILGTTTITSSLNSITITGSATDAVAGLNQYPYRFTIGSEVSGWLTSGTYTSAVQLTPDTQYPVKFEARDVSTVMHASQYSANIYTKAAIPSISVASITKTSFEITTVDNNPAGTQYQINIGSKYVSQSGALVTTPDWISLAAKKINVIELSPGTNYTVKAKARNTSGVETVQCPEKNVTTLPLPPTAPSGLSNTSKSQTAVTLVWNTVQEASSYAIQRYNTQTGETVFTGVSSPYTDTGLAANTSYEYKVRGDNTGGDGEWSSNITVTTLPNPPAAPTGLSAQLSVGATTVSWNAISDADSYDVYINGSFAGNVNTPQYEHTGITPDTQYTYEICGKNTGGNGALSSQLIKYSLPNLPSGVIVDNITNNSVHMSWMANDNPLSVQYNVAAFDTQDVFVKENLAWTYDLEALLTGLDPSKIYKLKIKARNSEGSETSWQEVDQVETLPNPPGVPINITATSRDTSVNLKWSIVQVAAGYDVERNGVVIATDLTSPEFADDGLTPETIYHYRVRAKNAGGSSSWSSELQKTTLPVIPDMPGNIAASSTLTSITVTWDAVVAATGYDIEIDGIVTNAGKDTQYVQNGLIPGSLHNYRVRTRNEAGKSNWSMNLAQSTVNNPPMIPDNLSALTSDTSITTTWDSAEGAESYTLEADGLEIQGITDTSYIHNGLLPGTVHYYKVKAVNNGGQSDWTMLLESATQEAEDDAPTITISKVTTNSIELSWNTVDGATGYELEVDGSTTEAGLQAIFIHNGLYPGTLHTYRVRSCNNELKGSWSILNSIYSLPGLPDHIETNTTTTTAVVSWSTVQGATGYSVEADGILINNGASTRYIHTGIEPGSTHTYRILAKNNSGDGAFTSSFNAMTMMVTTDIPSNILVQTTMGGISISWDIIPRVDGYQLEIDSGLPIDIEDAAYNHEGLMAGTPHIYRVRSVTGAKASDWSEALTAFTLPECPQTVDINDINATDSSVAIGWNAIDTATGYEVEADGLIVLVGQSTTYLDSGLTGQSQHRYRVRAIGEGGKGQWSVEKQVLTLTGQPGVPVNLTTSTTSTVITFNWSGVAGATGYNVERDGIVVDTGINTGYTLEGQTPGTIHTFRVRAVTDGVSGPWSGQMSCSTNLDTPQNIAACVSGNDITLTWDTVMGATLYDIKVDGVLILNVAGTTYTAIGLGAGTRHSFSVRAKNDSTAGYWSDDLSQCTQGLSVNFECSMDEEFDVSLYAAGIRDFNQYIFTIEYDPQELKIIDLYSLTPGYELTAGNIPGTDIRIISVIEGKLLFDLATVIQPGQEWSGNVIILKFRSMLEGQTDVTYSIQ